MVDAITPISATPSPFDTAAIQLAQAQALAAAAQANKVAFLKEIADSNDIANAQALSGTAKASNDPLSNLQHNPDAPPADFETDPTALSLNVFGADLSSAVTSDSSKAQQIHDLGVLQRDAELLEQAANVDSHIPLATNSASTVDLSVQAQDIVNATSVDGAPPLTAAQLEQIAILLQPVAEQPLTPELVQQLQTQLTASQNPIELNLNTITLAMNLIASLQPSATHATGRAPKVNNETIVAPVSAVDKTAAEDSAIR